MDQLLCCLLSICRRCLVVLNRFPLLVELLGGGASCPVRTELSVEPLHRNGRLQAGRSILEDPQLLSVLLQGLIVGCRSWVCLKHEACGDIFSGLLLLLHAKRAGYCCVEHGLRVDKETLVAASGATPEQNTVLKFARFGLLFFSQ